MCGEPENKDVESEPSSDKERVKSITELEEKLELLQKQLRLEEEKRDASLKQLKYLQADYENCLKRTQREIERISKFGNERLIASLLEIVDELELACAASEDTAVSEEVKKGVRMTLEKLRRVLDQEGVTVIESENRPFNPEMHQAISKEYSKDHEEGIVLRELRKGYLLRGKVIRPSTVVVSSPESGSSKE